MDRIKSRGRIWILAVLCVLLAAATIVLTVLCVRAAKDLQEALQTRDRLSVSADTLRGELDSLNVELDRLESERERSEEDLSVKTAKIESLEELIDGLNSERENLNGENDELTAQLEEANRVADLLREDIESLNRRVEAKREAASVLRERSQKLTEAVESLEGELSDAQDALDEKKSELTDAKKKLMTTQTELKVAQSERNDAQNELEDVKSELDDTKSELDDTKTELKDTKEALDASEKARKTAEEKLVPAVTEKKSAASATQPAAYNNAEKTLLNTLANAPDRWDWTDNKTKLVEVKATVAYYTAAIDGSEELAYNADTILYAASLIKAPYILTVLREIENFEKTAERDKAGKIVYRSWEKKYDLDEEWVYDPETMKADGSGEIMNKAAGFRLTWRELFEYALLYSDNIAFSQIYNRFGFTSFNSLVWQLGIKGQSAGFMYLTARDCGKFLGEIYRYFETGSAYALWMKDLMTRSRYGEMIAVYYPAGTVAHKYGWDVNAFHDMAIVYAEKPYVIVIMTDYEDGGNAAFAFFATVVDQTKAVYASK
ncbi:MAG: serine hydrolase [Clostridiales bacterium]|nr:serine hydrolase [Clostridiales bacterium]